MLTAKKQQSEAAAKKQKQQNEEAAKKQKQQSEAAAKKHLPQSQQRYAKMHRLIVALALQFLLVAGEEEGELWLAPPCEQQQQQRRPPRP
jgi:hypothetical protein